MPDPGIGSPSAVEEQQATARESPPPRSTDEWTPATLRASAIRATPFYLASTALTLIAVLVWQLGAVTTAPAPPGLVALLSVMLTVAAALIAGPLLVRAFALQEEPRTQDVEARRLLRELVRHRALMESQGDALGGTTELLRLLQVKADALAVPGADDRERSRRLRLDLGAVRSDVRAWVDTAIECLRYFERILDQLPEDHPGRPLAQNASDVVRKLMLARKLECIVPVRGDPFLAELHEVAREEPADGAAPGTIVRCLEWGYRWNGDLIRRARVSVAS